MKTSSSKLSVAVLGAGYISDFHIDAIRQVAGVELRAICDLNRPLAERYARTYGIPNCYGDLAEMLDRERLDVVHVLTPPMVHAANGKQILAAGVDVLMEKPLCHRHEDCVELAELAQAGGRALGVSHNFLFCPAYERLVADLRAGRLGQVDQVDIVWNKELGQLTGGPFHAWMLAHPTNILFEVAPHSFAHLLHLIGSPESLHVSAQDPLTLPSGVEFLRRWEILGWHGKTSIRLRFSFIDGYSEHYIHVRGTAASARVDFENNTYVKMEHTPYLLDIDRFATTCSAASAQAWQGAKTLTHFVLSKVKLSRIKGPFAHSIARSVNAFYATRETGLDERISSDLGSAVVRLAERVAELTPLPTPSDKGEVAPIPAVALPPSPLPAPARILVLGGTGFIGKSLVKKLHAAGHSVRLVARNPRNLPPELADLQLDVVRGDLGDTASLEAAMDGIEVVYHLARGSGKTWNDYRTTDVEPTSRFAAACARRNIKRFFYASSIALYAAGKRAGVITEATIPHPGLLRAAPYARCKAENERILMELHHNAALPLVIFRPGVVIGPGTSPYHWGVAAWPYHSVCNLWGDGRNPLPFVLVEDVAEAMLLALDTPGIEGSSFNLASPPCLSAHDYLDELQRHAGLHVRRCPVPAWRGYVTSLAKWAFKKVGRDPDVDLPSYADWDGRSLAARFDCSRAERFLGWKPAQDRAQIIQQGIHAMLDEYCR